MNLSLELRVCMAYFFIVTMFNKSSTNINADLINTSKLNRKARYMRCALGS